MNGRTIRSVLLVGVLFVVSSAQAPPPDLFDLSRHTVDGGGGTSAGGGYTLAGTIGQPDAAARPMTGGAYALVGGFRVVPPCVLLVGDSDRDCDVDLEDFIVFQRCFAGPNRSPAPLCPPGVPADLDGDSDVDLADFQTFVLNFTGPG